MQACAAVRFRSRTGCIARAATCCGCTKLIVEVPLVAARLAYVTLIVAFVVAVSIRSVFVQAVAAVLIFRRRQSTAALLERALCLVLIPIVEAALAVLGHILALIITLVTFASLNACAAVVRWSGSGAATGINGA